MSVRAQRRILFRYPSLPPAEVLLYFILVICATSYAWVSVFISSGQFHFKLDRPSSVHKLPFFGYRVKDESNWEWSRWSPFALSYLPFLIIHSIIFNVGFLSLPEKIVPYISTAYSIFVSFAFFTPWLVFLSMLQGTFIFIVSHFAKKKAMVWISTLPLLYQAMHHTFSFSQDPFLVLVFVSYSLLSYISYNLEMIDGNVRDVDDVFWKRYFRMMFYTFYLPYMITLVITYPEFERRMLERKIRPREWGTTALFALRIAFWWLFIEFILHFLYFEAMLYDTEFASKLPKNVFVTLGMALGLFFHMKYLVIFGLPSIFARIDNMQPLDGPICIGRVTLYSKVWRYFDRGLYSFFKRYIFLPICQPTFSTPRKIFGILLSFSFVLLWHGFYRHNVIWIILNILGLFVEYGGKGLYSVEAIRKWRETNISDVAFRRILACFQIIPFIFGIYSNFYFLGGYQVGSLFVQRIWNEETYPTFRYPAALLITLGYFYAQITIEVERRLEMRDQNLKTD